MAFNADTYFEDITPSHLRQWINEGWKAPASGELKAGTMVEVDTTAAKTIKRVASAGTTAFLGALAHNVLDLSGGAIEGIRDLVTLDRNLGDTVTIIKGGVLRMGAQDATDLGAGYAVDITRGDDLYLTANGGITNVSTNANFVGVAHNSVTKANNDILEFTFRPIIRLP